MSGLTFHHIADNQRIGFDQDAKTFKEQGEVQRSNIFKQVSNFLKRLGSDEAKNNKATAQEFLERIELEYGKQVRKMASRMLPDQLQWGSPLTGARAKKVIEVANAMVPRIQGENTDIMKRTFQAVL